MTDRKVGVLGASSLVGRYVIDLMVASGYSVVAFSRNPVVRQSQSGVSWSNLYRYQNESDRDKLMNWICLCPIWVIADHFELLKRAGVKRVVTLSSTSRFTKSLNAGASNSGEIALAKRLEEGERVLSEWAERNEIEWVILRPTLIYDLERDKNLSQIVAFIRRYGFFPLLGSAQGRRQPVHALEVAQAVFAAMRLPSAANQDYNISGGETMTYREMVERIFVWLGKPPRFVQVPMVGFEIAIWLARIFPKYRHLSGSMAQRMSQDLVFDHAKAQRDLGYCPGKFSSVQPGDD